MISCPALPDTAEPANQAIDSYLEDQDHRLEASSPVEVAAVTRVNSTDPSAQVKLPPAEFVRLWTSESRRLLSFLASLGLNWSDAEEVLQEVSVTAWEKRDEFRPGSNFGAWVRQIAKFKALSRFRLNGSKPVPSDSLADLIADEFESRSAELDERHSALESCVKKLAPKDIQLLQLRYGREFQANAIADAVGRSVGAVYTALHRIHRALHACVSLQMEGHQ